MRLCNASEFNYAKDVFVGGSLIAAKVVICILLGVVEDFAGNSNKWQQQRLVCSAAKRAHSLGRRRM